MDNLKMFIPMCKIDEEKRLVYGIATQEVLDKSDEVMDYESSKPMFEKWSQDIEKASGGKSVGNLREMHSNKAAGKITQLDFNDSNKAIEVCAKVVDEESWVKVQEGVLTGFSIGGAYAKRWKGEDGNMRFTADPAEISLVDNPCCPTATFEVIKANGVTEQREFKHKEAETVPDEINKELLDDFKKALANKDLAKAFSFEEITNRLDGALNSQIKTPFNCGYFWIKATYPDSVIICGDIDGDRDQDLYRVAYTMTEDGVITLGEIQEVKMEFVPAVDEDDTNTMAGLSAEKAAESDDLEKKDDTNDLDKSDDEQPQEHDAEFYKMLIEQEVKMYKHLGKVDVEDFDLLVKRRGFTDDETQTLISKLADEGLEVSCLVKAGAKHSKETVSALQKMSHNLNEIGGACKCDKCMKMYKDDSTDDMTLAAQTADLNKGTESNQELNKALEGLTALQKAFEGLEAKNKELLEKVAKLEEEPVKGGPVLNAGAINKSLPGNPQGESQNPINDEITAWDTIINKAHDPQIVQNARLQKAQLLMKQTLSR